MNPGSSSAIAAPTGRLPLPHGYRGFRVRHRRGLRYQYPCTAGQPNRVGDFGAFGSVSWASCGATCVAVG
jgi:hypothetical protein